MGCCNSFSKWEHHGSLFDASPSFTQWEPGGYHGKVSRLTIAGLHVVCLSRLHVSWDVPIQ